VFYINDVCRLFDNICIGKLYANDVMCYSYKRIQRQLSLAEFLHKLAVWSRTWQRTISYKKCSILLIGKHDNDRLVRFENYRLQRFISLNTLTCTSMTNCNSMHIIVLLYCASHRTNLILEYFYSKDTKVLARH
jgi:hypothetical protein